MPQMLVRKQRARTMFDEVEKAAKKRGWCYRDCYIGEGVSHQSIGYYGFLHIFFNHILWLAGGEDPEPGGGMPSGYNWALAGGLSEEVKADALAMLKEAEDAFAGQHIKVWAS